LLVLEGYLVIPNCCKHAGAAALPLKPSKTMTATTADELVDDLKAWGNRLYRRKYTSPIHHSFSFPVSIVFWYLKP
jgi:hypothetical protein